MGFFPFLFPGELLGNDILEGGNPVFWVHSVVSLQSIQKASRYASSSVVRLQKKLLLSPTYATRWPALCLPLYHGRRGTEAK